MNATYILPIRLRTPDAIPELAQYLATLKSLELVVVDGSPDDIFAQLGQAIGGLGRHVRPGFPGANGKARGVLTGLALASHENVIVADDDVRYDRASLCEVLRRLESAAVVRPQNYFTPLPWHAVYDTARTLINRAFDGDWPGTLAFRRSALPHGYNADVLFENYELVRTIRMAGGREAIARDVFVARRPPTYQQFIGQRVRQAYDEFARPLRLCAGLALLPALFAGWRLAGIVVPLTFAAFTMALAAAGWMRDGGWRYFPVFSILAAPLWSLERGCCSWLALWERVRFGGMRYAGSVIAAAASPPREVAK